MSEHVSFFELKVSTAWQICIILQAFAHLLTAPCESNPVKNVRHATNRCTAHAQVGAMVMRMAAVHPSSKAYLSAALLDCRQ